MNHLEYRALMDRIGALESRVADLEALATAPTIAERVADFAASDAEIEVQDTPLMRQINAGASNGALPEKRKPGRPPKHVEAASA